MLDNVIYRWDRGKGDLGPPRERRYTGTGLPERRAADPPRTVGGDSDQAQRPDPRPAGRLVVCAMPDRSVVRY